ncbi:hypothetical protein ACXR2T_10695 [Leucobacter sp. HY1910]
MTEHIDHVAEARRLQGGARDIIRAANKAPGTLAPHMAAVIMLDDARLEAQLALVEQQRIANLIALGSAERGPYRYLDAGVTELTSEDALGAAAVLLGIDFKEETE